MGKSTGITWTDATWNPWQGCHPVSEGCANCYMYREKRQYGQDPTVVVRSSPSTFRAPARWKDPRIVFVCSWSDFFVEEADPWRAEAWDVMRRAPWHTYLLLTKRIERAAECLPPGWPWPNVWLGVTAENQRRAEERVPQLLEIPAAGRFVSVEPLLGPVRMNDGYTSWLTCDGRHKIGGECCEAWAVGGGPIPRVPWCADPVLRQATLRPARSAADSGEGGEGVAEQSQDGVRQSAEILCPECETAMTVELLEWTPELRREMHIRTPERIGLYVWSGRCAICREIRQAVSFGASPPTPLVRVDWEILRSGKRRDA